MNTLEMLIVLAALMAVIALVAIAIDWVGRPLRNKRFIPRIYRYEDEIGPDPLDQPLGAAGLAGPVGSVSSHAQHQGTLTPVGSQPAMATAPVGPIGAPARPATQPEPVPVATVDSRVSTSAFSESVAPSGDDGDRQPREIAETVPIAAAPEWHPGMALDARAGERKPTVAVKAERYWRETASLVSSNSHFDDRALELMSQGKPPRRRNPRTGEVELMELVGLRSASGRGDVRMRWPDDSVDPWSAS